MGSKDRQQLELLPSERPQPVEITADLVDRVRRLPTFLRAWNYAQDISCLEDKTVYSALNIDASHWTKIKKGNASPPANESFTRFFDVVNNDIPLIWLAEARGYDSLSLRKHRSSLERENEALREELALKDKLLSLVLPNGAKLR